MDQFDPNVARWVMSATQSRVQSRNHKFQIEIFMGYNFTRGGGRIFDFPSDFCMGLTKCSANALPVIPLTAIMATKTDQCIALNCVSPLLLITILKLIHILLNVINVLYDCVFWSQL